MQDNRGYGREAIQSPPTPMQGLPRKPASKLPWGRFLCLVGPALMAAMAPASVRAEGPLAAPRRAVRAAVITTLNAPSQYQVRTSPPPPKEQPFSFSRDIRNVIKHLEKIARHGIDLDAPLPPGENLQLRFEKRGLGGIVMIQYQH